MLSDSRLEGSKNVLQYHHLRTSLAVHCMRPRFNPWLGTKIPHATRCDQKKKKKKITVCIHYQPTVYNSVKPICTISYYRWGDKTSLILRSLQYFSREKSVYAWSFKFSFFFSVKGWAVILRVYFWATKLHVSVIDNYVTGSGSKAADAKEVLCLHLPHTWLKAMKWIISCHTGKQGCQSHQGF